MKIGDRVYYISGKFGMALNNPLKGTDYECQGTIREISARTASIEVLWDNETSNGYDKSDLQIVSAASFDPNEAFKARKRGERRNG
jgi:hypothetical protein